MICCNHERKQQQQTRFVNYNREGVMLLQQGKHKESLTMFSLGLKSLGFDLLPTDVIDSITAIVPKESTSLMDSITSVPITFDDSSDSTETSSPYNSFCCCTRALSFHVEFENEIRSASGRNIVALVLTFNLGLTFHLRGMRTSKSSSYNLSQALGLYRMATALLERCTETSDCCCIQHHYAGEVSIRMKNIFRLVLFSNMGHIFSHFFMLNEANQCRSLLIYLLELACNGRNIGLRQSLSDEEKLVLFMNGLVLANSSATKSAAAA